MVIGNDGRHHSRTYAERAAAAFLHKGFKVFLFSGTVPTPLVVRPRPPCAASAC